MTAARPVDDGAGLVIEETLGIAGDGAAIVQVISDAGRSYLYQFRRAGQVVVEAVTLRALAELIRDTDPTVRAG